MPRATDHAHSNYSGQQLRLQLGARARSAVSPRSAAGEQPRGAAKARAAARGRASQRDLWAPAPALAPRAAFLGQQKMKQAGCFASVELTF